MIILTITAYGSLALFAVGHLIPAFIAFRNQKITLLGIGLVGLGALNVLSGLAIGLLVDDLVLASVAVVAGMLSINLGNILNGYIQHDMGPNWNIESFRIGLSVFLVGLLMIYG
jgi:hypothetical protein